MSKRKMVITGIVIFIVLLAVYGYNEAKKMIAVFDKMGIKPETVSNIDISLQRIKFNINIILSNASDDDFDVNGYGFVKLREVKVFYNNVYLATSTLNITGMVIPARMNLVVEDVPVEVPKPLVFVSRNLPLVYGMMSNFDQNKISCTALIEVAGNLIEIP